MKCVSDILQRCWCPFVAVLLCTFCLSGAANAAQISGARVGQGVGSVRIVMDADSQFDYKVFLLNEPRRLVVDTQNAEASARLQQNIAMNDFVSSLHFTG